MSSARVWTARLLVLCYAAVEVHVANEEFWSSSFLEMESCEPRQQRGGWCEWGEWSPCEAATCTRTRSRICACPTPADWKRGACPAVLPQDDFKTLKTHTRFVRTTNKGRCIIPFFVEGKYYGDCALFPGSKTPQCMVESGGKLKRETCSSIVDTMEERDVGPCDDWRLAEGWFQSGLPDYTKTIIDEFSKAGKQCYNPKIYSLKPEAIEECPEKYYFSMSGQRNVYSNLNNLAFNQENCKFACAIEPKCVAVEFAEGFFCALLTKFEKDKLIRQVGTTLFTKPDVCSKQQALVDPVGYPYALALEDLYVSVN